MGRLGIPSAAQIPTNPHSSLAGRFVCVHNALLFRTIRASVTIQVFPVCARCANTQQRKELCLKLSKLSARWNTRVRWKEGREEQKGTVSLVTLISETCCCLQSWILALERLLVEQNEKWASLSKDFDGKGNWQEKLSMPRKSIHWVFILLARSLVSTPHCKAGSEGT